MLDSTLLSESDNADVSDPKERKRLRNKAYYQANKHKRDAYRKQKAVKEKRSAAYRQQKKDEKWLEKKREMDRFYSRQYRLRHPERRKETQERYRAKHPERCKASYRKCVAKNPDLQLANAAAKSRKYRAKFKKRNGVCYSTFKSRKDPVFALISSVRSRTWQALSKADASKCTTTVRLLGCTVSELFSYVESLFLPGMTWDNRGKWHLDHIVPLASFDLRQPDQQTAAFHYTNLQPLWASDNLRKSDKVSGQRLFGFAYAAKIADGVSSKRKRGRSRHASGQHGDD